MKESKLLMVIHVGSIISSWLYSLASCYSVTVWIVARFCLVFHLCPAIRLVETVSIDTPSAKQQQPGTIFPIDYLCLSD